jgi:probable F420-dependent oxidoreductase
MSMTEKSLGVFLYPDGYDAKDLREFAQRFEKLGYSAIWYPEVLVYESFTLGGYLLSQTTKITIASGIANIYGRDAIGTLQASQGLEAMYPGRYITGLGVSHKSIVTDIRGHEYGPPMATLVKYLDDMDRGRKHLIGKDTPLVIGALGPKMMELAAKRNCGVHPFNSPPEHTRWARELVGPDTWICTAQHVCNTTDPILARAAARKALEYYFVTPNHYRNWLRVGYTKDDLENGGSDRLIDALVAWGTESQIRDRVQQHFDAGATQVIINSINIESINGGGVDIAGFNYQSSPQWDVYEMLSPTKEK